MIVGAYVIYNVYDTPNDWLNKPSEPLTINFVLLYPSYSVTFPILPIDTTHYIHLYVNLTYSGIIAEKQVVNLTAEGFISTSELAQNVSDVVVDFFGAVQQNPDGSSAYGPWYSGIILRKGEVEDGHTILTGESTPIVWNVQGYYHPILVVRYTAGNNVSVQEYPYFPVYVNGYSDFQQAKSNKLNTALSFAVLVLTIVASIELVLILTSKIKGKNGLFHCITEAEC